MRKLVFILALAVVLLAVSAVAYDSREDDLESDFYQSIILPYLYLKRDEEELSDAEGSLMCTTQNLNVRDSPCTSGNLVKTLPSGAQVSTTGNEKTACGYTWVQISDGWAAKNWLKACSSSTGDSSSTAGNPGFHYDKATKDGKGPQPGARQLQSWCQSMAPSGRPGGIYNYRNVRGGTSLSLHAEGRAVDWMLSVNNSKQKAEGDKIVEYLVGNPENAKRMGIQEVIWNKKIWSSTRPHEGMRAYTGTNPHTDHVHIGMNKWGAQNYKF